MTSCVTFCRGENGEIFIKSGQTTIIPTKPEVRGFLHRDSLTKRGDLGKKVAIILPSA